MSCIVSSWLRIKFAENERFPEYFLFSHIKTDGTQILAPPVSQIYDSFPASVCCSLYNQHIHPVIYFTSLSTFCKFPVTDLKFFTIDRPGKLAGFYKFIRHSNKKLSAVLFHRIKLFIFIVHAIDKSGDSERHIG